MDDETNRSPRITSISWGSMDVDGLAPGKDFKLDELAATHPVGGLYHSTC